MKRVNCLLRVSSKQQLREDDIPVQRKECQCYLAMHSDWTFQKEYIEKAVSGFKTSIKDRDILQEILEDAREKRFEVLLVYMSDRIGRKEDESPAFVTALNNFGIEVWSVREGQLKTAEHIDKLLNYIRFWQAEGESRKTGMRVKDAQETLVRAGRYVGGKAPFGYDLEYSGAVNHYGRALKHLVINPQAAAVVRKIFDYSVHYNYGNLKIAKVLNEKGEIAPKDMWKACTVAQILQNPVYMGHIAYNRRKRSINGGSLERMPMETWIMSEEQIPELVIIPREIWYKAQKRREDRRAMFKRGIGQEKYGISSGGQLRLTGLLYCGYCGCRLTNGSKYAYWTTEEGEKRKKFIGRYKCVYRSGGSLSCNGKAYYRSEELESVIYSLTVSYLNRLKEYDINENILKLQIEQKKLMERELVSLTKEIEAVERDIETLRQNIPAALRGESFFHVEKLASLIKDKEQRMRKLMQSKERKSQQYKAVFPENRKNNNACNVISDWGNLFLECSIPEQKVILAELIERIEVKDNDVTVKFRMSLKEYGSEVQ